MKGGETMRSILTTVKKLLGISEEDYSFDVDILLYINTTIALLSQLGLSEADKLSIVDEDSTWTDLIGDRKDLEFVKTYICMKSKMMFDPPTNSSAIQATERMIDELEWRISNLDRNKGGVI